MAQRYTEPLVCALVGSSIRQASAQAAAAPPRRPPQGGEPGAATLAERDAELLCQVRVCEVLLGGGPWGWEGRPGAATLAERDAELLCQVCACVRVGSGSKQTREEDGLQCTARNRHPAAWWFMWPAHNPTLCPCPWQL